MRGDLHVIIQFLSKNVGDAVDIVNAKIILQDAASGAAES